VSASSYFGSKFLLGSNYICFVSLKLSYSEFPSIEVEGLRPFLTLYDSTRELLSDYHIMHYMGLSETTSFLVIWFQVTTNDDHPIRARHFEDQVCVVWNCHKLSKPWHPDDCMVSCIDVRHLEV
jgi:hypothetical protein